jgi:hypothetical protein
MGRHYSQTSGATTPVFWGARSKRPPTTANSGDASARKVRSRYIGREDRVETGFGKAYPGDQRVIVGFAGEGTGFLRH